MKTAKKIEIIIESVYLPHVVKIFDALALPGYTIINGVSGRGLHGLHDAQELTDVSSNSYIIIICSQDQSNNLINSMRKELEKYGGICFLSEISQLIVTHNKLL
jgi:nitrogen regulatory protein PII